MCIISNEKKIDLVRLPYINYKSCDRVLNVFKYIGGYKNIGWTMGDLYVPYIEDFWGEQEPRVNVFRENRLFKKIRGDGNCFFRAMSFIIYGNQKHHLFVRHQYCDFLEAIHNGMIPGMDELKEQPQFFEDVDIDAPLENGQNEVYFKFDRIFRKKGIVLPPYEDKTGKNLLEHAVHQYPHKFDQRQLGQLQRILTSGLSKINSKVHSEFLRLDKTYATQHDKALFFVMAGFDKLDFGTEYQLVNGSALGTVLKKCFPVTFSVFANKSTDPEEEQHQGIAFKKQSFHTIQEAVQDKCINLMFIQDHYDVEFYPGTIPLEGAKRVFEDPFVPIFKKTDDPEQTDLTFDNIVKDTSEGQLQRQIIELQERKLAPKPSNE